MKGSEKSPCNAKYKCVKRKAAWRKESDAVVYTDLDEYFLERERKRKREWYNRQSAERKALISANAMKWQTEHREKVREYQRAYRAQKKAEIAAEKAAREEIERLCKRG